MIDGRRRASCRHAQEMTMSRSEFPVRSLPVPAASAPARKLSPAAERALAEAAARRATAREMSRVAEVGGRGGLDPIRYGDWEVRGLASDF